MNTCTSVERLQEIKDITPETAALIRKVWKGNRETVSKLVPDMVADIERGLYNPLATRELKREIINRLADTHGIEYLGVYKPSGDNVDYCNAGDPYATTIVFIGPRLVVTDWGTMIERNQIKETSCGF